ncbi:MAG: 6-phosphofructokinase [Saprospiraceae bacterium]|nr:6-phosphofructokinase [Saprospiraceae bacterium]
MSKNMKRIAVYTSGGDAPGMNAALRAVVRTSAYHEVEVFGITGGYEGMMNGNMQKLEPREVGNIIQRGGTFLKTARSMRFMKEEGRNQAADVLKKHNIDGLIALGGNGTFTGAEIFSKEHGIPVVGVPCTIDNDLYGTDYTIGFDTALNTAVEAVDKIRDTAESHDRLFFIEVMGRDSGYLALHTAIASGATLALLPEIDTTYEALAEVLKTSAERKKLFSLIIVAEGNKLGKTSEIAEELKSRVGAYDTRVAVIGHLQRGGSPSGADRLLASRLGSNAVEALINGHKNVMVGIDNNMIKYTPLGIAIRNQKEINMDEVRLAEILAL